MLCKFYALARCSKTSHPAKRKNAKETSYLLELHAIVMDHRTYASPPVLITLSSKTPNDTECNEVNKQSFCEIHAGQLFANLVWIITKSLVIYAWITFSSFGEAMDSNCTLLWGLGQRTADDSVSFMWHHKMWFRHILVPLSSRGIWQIQHRWKVRHIWTIIHSRSIHMDPVCRIHSMSCTWKNEVNNRMLWNHLWSLTSIEFSTGLAFLITYPNVHVTYPQYRHGRFNGIHLSIVQNSLGT